MTPKPMTVGLFLCDQVIVEVGTQKVSPIGIFTGLATDGFPFLAPPFTAFAAFTDGRGEVTITLTVVQAATDEEIYTQDNRVRFRDPLTELRFILRIRGCEFPAAGTYYFNLLVDGDLVASRRLRVYEGRVSE
jgi:hypothetical protein